MIQITKKDTAKRYSTLDGPNSRWAIAVFSSPEPEPDQKQEEEEVACGKGPSVWQRARVGIRKQKHNLFLANMSLMMHCILVTLVNGYNVLRPGLCLVKDASLLWSQLQKPQAIISSSSLALPLHPQIQKQIKANNNFHVCTRPYASSPYQTDIYSHLQQLASSETCGNIAIYIN